MRHLLKVCVGAACRVAVLAILRPVSAEEIRLKNGSSISGIILSENDEVVTLNRHGQDLTLKKETIEAIDRLSLAYYNQEFKKAVEASDEPRLIRLFAAMSIHAEDAVRQHGTELENRYGGDSSDEAWQGESLARLSISRVRARFRESVDRLRWNDAVLYGRELLRRGENNPQFTASMLEAFRNSRLETHFLFMDVLRLLEQTSREDMRVAQVYLLSSIEERMLELWNPDRPTRNDSEVNALMIVRGLLINLDQIAPAGSPYRKGAESVLATFIRSDSWDGSIAEIDDLYTLLIFASASRARAELTPLFRYFALLKEPDILKADTTDALLANSVREARGVYIYTVSGIDPLPREKLWSSARDLAIIGSTKAPPVSEIIAEVFRYTPQIRHLDLCMAYEDLLVPEALRGADKGIGLGHAMELITTARCGNEFDLERSWEAFQGLAAWKLPPTGESTSVNPGISVTLSAMFSVASPFEQEKVCLLYDDRLISAATEAGDSGEGLYRAISLLASRRSSDTAEPARKWATFRALASLDRIAAGEDGSEPLTASRILQAAFSVCPEQNQLRLCMAFENQVVRDALDPAQHGPGLLKATRHIARQRVDDLSDAGASWRAFRALAAVDSDDHPGGMETLDPGSEQIFSTIFHEVPAERHGDIALRFEDRLVEAVVVRGETGPGIDRGAKSLAMRRLHNPVDPDSAWRAFELVAVLEEGSRVSPGQVMDQLAALAADSLRLQANALFIAASHYSPGERESDLVYRDHRAQWSAGIEEGVNAWINETARLKDTKNEVPVMPDLVLSELAWLKERQNAVNDHARLLRDLDLTEERLTAQYASAVDKVSEGNLRLIAGELNSLWSRTPSPAARDRIRSLLDETFDPATQAALVSNGLVLSEE